MASNNDPDHELIRTLYRLSKKSPKLVRSSTYPAPADPAVTIRSWKMNEFKYYDIPSPFPTLARGIFTRWESADKTEVREEAGEGEGEGNGKYRIVARGYDKFFNIGEVPWTNWKALESHTTAPYVLTLKSNGCIIFIAPLSSSKLLITSKHSVGPIKGRDRSHAQVGEEWLRKHLHKAGKTEAQLAQTLWDNRWTAVAELCDDNFEEHVLPYSEELTGLHLHGINSSAGAFQTRDPAEVEAFAREWGFITTAYTSLDSVDAVREFTQQVGKSGKWNGQPIEGFVVRTHIAKTDGAPASAADVLNVSGENRQGGRHKRDDRDAPPYPPGSSFFFKVKFDEPYMMYRDWRELTKSILSAKPGSQPRISKAKLARPETRLYKEWVEGEIKRDRAAFAEYQHGKGIIATRERFLKWCEKEGKGKLAAEMGQKQGMVGKGVEGEERKFGKTIILPVAIPGCGKTSIAVALTHLFGFGHTQNDDIKAKKAAPIFLKNVTDLLKTHNVVIADKNNHLGQHRQDLRQAVANFTPPVRLLALNWSLDQPPAIVHRICGDRVSARGANHQTLRADEAKAHEDVIWMFIDKTEGLAADEVDDIIEMEVAEDLEDGLARAVNGVASVLGLEKPSDEKLGEALRVARLYAPAGPKQGTGKKAAEANKADDGSKDKGKGKDGEAPARQRGPGKAPRYFGLLPEVDIDTIVGGRLAEADAPPAAKTFWDSLKKRHRVATRPHVTLVHSKSLPDEQELWDRCVAIHRTTAPPSFGFKLGHIVYDERVMAVTVEALRVASDEDSSDVEAGAQFLEKLPHEVGARLHITVGTRDRDVNPVEAKSLVEKWKHGAKVSSIALNDVEGRARVKGLFS